MSESAPRRARPRRFARVDDVARPLPLEVRSGVANAAIVNGVFDLALLCRLLPQPTQISARPTSLPTSRSTVCAERLTTYPFVFAFTASSLLNVSLISLGTTVTARLNIRAHRLVADSQLRCPSNRSSWQLPKSFLQSRSFKPSRQTDSHHCVPHS